MQELQAPTRLLMDNNKQSINILLSPLALELFLHFIEVFLSLTDLLRKRLKGKIN
jgi:hypothetical protein